MLEQPVGEREDLGRHRGGGREEKGQESLSGRKGGGRRKEEG